MQSSLRYARLTVGAQYMVFILGLPGTEGEDNLEEDSHRPLIDAENEDEYEPNYSIQEASAVAQVKAISFGQACCLPGVIPVRATPASRGKHLGACSAWVWTGWGRQCV